MEGDELIPTNISSGEVFTLADGTSTPASTTSKLHHKLREPARTVGTVPALKHNSLLSGTKFTDANYITVLTPTKDRRIDLWRRGFENASEQGIHPPRVMR